MRTTILVNGKRYEVEPYMYGGYDENDEYQMFLKGDIEEVVYEDHYKPLIASLEKRIEAYDEILADYESQLMETYKENINLPFATEEMTKLAKEHTSASLIVEGLREAVELATLLDEGGE